MRKHLRNKLRTVAKKAGIKQSKYVHEAWAKYQEKRVGKAAHDANVIKSTTPKRLWAYRCAILGGK